METSAEEVKTFIYYTSGYRAGEVKETKTVNNGTVTEHLQYQYKADKSKKMISEYVEYDMLKKCPVNKFTFKWVKIEK